MKFSKIIKKAISLSLAAVISVSSLCISDYKSTADVFTTQQEASGVDSVDTLLTYPEFNAKVADGAFIIPGLMYSASYNKSTKKVDTTQTMCPQAMCKAEKYTLITAYDSEEVSRSVIYVLGENKTLIKTLILPDSYHVGGIAYDSKNKLILITKASKCVVGAVSFDDFTNYLSSGSSFVSIKYTVEENDSDNFIKSASSVAYYNGNVYLSTFDSGSGSYAYCYTPVYDKSDNSYTLYYKYKFSLPSYTQGFSFCKYGSKVKMFVSVSYGRNETKGIYCSYLYTYNFTEKTGAKSLDNVLSCPPMLELTFAENGKLFCLFESASTVYKSVSRKPLSYAVPLNLSLLCDEKSGSVVNISTTNVSGGKKVKITSSLSGSKIYYSTSMPYYSYSKLVSGYIYKGSYTKTTSSTVYAVAVKNGRIVGADAMYIKVSTAAAPKNLKVKKKTKSTVNISWSAAANATSYQIYRSTKKSSGYKKVATVAATKKSYTDKKLEKNKKYYYKVRAVRKGYKNSSFTKVVSAVTKKK